MGNPTPIARGPVPRPVLRRAETVGVIVAAGALLAVIFLVTVWRGSPMNVYPQDPAALFGFSPLAGVISYLGVLATVAAGAICIFVSCHVSEHPGLLVRAGWFSVVIALDDLFMVHEGLAPRAGIPEIVLIGLYGVGALAILAQHRQALVGPAQVGLHVAVALLAGSALADLLVEHSRSQIIFEDSLKFAGLLLWAAYWMRRAHLGLRAHPVGGAQARPEAVLPVCQWNRP